MKNNYNDQVNEMGKACSMEVEMKNTYMIGFLYENHKEINLVVCGRII
jgi:hypothetical protein